MSAGRKSGISAGPLPPDHGEGRIDLVGGFAAPDGAEPLSRGDVFHVCVQPDRDEDGAVRGNLITVTETTAIVLGGRRLRTLHHLGARLADVKSINQTCQIAVEVLRANPSDIRFALLYLSDSDQAHALLAGATCDMVDERFSPARLGIDAQEPWPLGRVLKSREIASVELLFVEKAWSASET